MLVCDLCEKPIICKATDMLTADKFEIDGMIFCIDCFHTLLENGLLFEGQDDEWHIKDYDAFELLL